jgi:hypothetical protein
MPQTSYSPLECRQMEVAGSVVLKVLRILPDSASAEMLRELIDMVLVDPADRALFEFLGNRRENPDDEASPVTIPPIIFYPLRWGGGR